MEKFTERPAVGTRVTLRKVFGDVWLGSHDGESGVVISGGGVSSAYVLFDDRKVDSGAWTSLEPEVTPAIAVTPEPAPEVIIDGVRYVPAPEQEPEKVEEKREPKQGEIWRFRMHTGRDNLWLIGDAGCVMVAGNNPGQIAIRFNPAEEFAYPSLAAAAEAGEIK